ncbi:MAG: MgpA protein, phosphoesterase RecJ domain-containing protein [Candidatus Peregrinibacteria bacterium GW2011_GWC2_39_14]|nr:MAG: MgpA protein [Candidatus Peregrinibacteria bacterium GW2011_GWA2_38_36]KKR06625.1 MAG: MgpA protein, phosphoesterase RecJ domain-containing protein [Candidatus Peregrinibacteria bacterium GW2011_GWC2_39_14]
MAHESDKKQIIDFIKASNKILVMPSAPVDCDSIGSALSLYVVLKKLGKEVTVVSADPVPNVYEFLPVIHAIGDRLTATKDFIITIDTHKTHVAEIKKEEEDGKTHIVITPKGGRFSPKDISINYGPEKYDLIITVDTATLEQLGRSYEDNVDMFTQIPVLNIDHHISNEQFGKVNYVDAMASSTTEILIPIIEQLEKETGKALFDDDIATLLLAGIITDTGSFQNANTTPKSFDWAAYLIAKGGRQQEIIQRIYKTKPLSTLKLWGKVLSKIQIDEAYKFVWSTVTQKDFKDTESDEEHVGEIIDDLLSNAPGAEVILLLKEKSVGVISGSIRTTSASVDASEIASIFGGGGHSRAAGFKVKNPDFDKVYKYVIEKIKEYQANRLNIVADENGEDIGVAQKVETPDMTPVYKYEAQATEAQVAENKAETVAIEKEVVEELESEIDGSKPKKRVGRKAKTLKEKESDREEMEKEIEESGAKKTIKERATSGIELKLKKDETAEEENSANQDESVDQESSNETHAPRSGYRFEE